MLYSPPIDHTQGISVTTTKITLKIRNDILDAFNRRLESCYLKRDAFLNYIIKTETRHLKVEMKGKEKEMARKRGLKIKNKE